MCIDSNIQEELRIALVENLRLPEEQSKTCNLWVAGGPFAETCASVAAQVAQENQKEGNQKMSIDWDKPIVSVDGDPARYLGKLDTLSEYRHIVVVKRKIGEESFTVNGKGFSTAPGRAVANANAEYSVWVNVYRDNAMPSKSVAFGVAFPTREGAETAVGTDYSFRIACVNIKFKEGDGLVPTKGEE